LFILLIIQACYYHLCIFVSLSLLFLLCISLYMGLPSRSIYVLQLTCLYTIHMYGIKYCCYCTFTLYFWYCERLEGIQYR
jgi:hypothetical protein